MVIRKKKPRFIRSDILQVFFREQHSPFLPVVKGIFNKLAYFKQLLFNHRDLFKDLGSQSIMPEFISSSMIFILKDSQVYERDQEIIDRLFINNLPGSQCIFPDLIRINRTLCPFCLDKGLQNCQGLFRIWQEAYLFIKEAP